MMNQPRLKLRYVLVALIFITGALAYQFGYSKRDKAPPLSEVEKAYIIVTEDLKAHAAMRRALRSAQAEAEGDDFLSDMCAGDPKKCGRGQ